jgi:hypothetical protein
VRDETGKPTARSAIRSTSPSACASSRS